MKSVAPSAATAASKLGRLLDIEQITRTLAFLAGYRPAVFEAAPDDASCEAPRPPLDGRMVRGDGPEPYCTVCGEPTGIFFGHGPDWHHFRTPDSASGAASAAGVGAMADSGAGLAEVYAADHAPAIGWRYTTPAASTGSACPDPTTP
jgi:hypothetical protein